MTYYCKGAARKACKKEESAWTPFAGGRCDECFSKHFRAVLARPLPIEIDNSLMRDLGYDSTRDFFYALGNWGHNTDFGTLPSTADDRVQTYLRAFIRSQLD